MQTSLFFYTYSVSRHSQLQGITYGLSTIEFDALYFFGQLAVIFHGQDNVLEA